jgi:DNA-binding LytR/AlgR family response regulator
MQIKCLLVDDEPLALEVLESMILKIAGIKIVAKCRDAVEAYQMIHNNQIDLVFLDIHMPEVSGIGLLRSLTNPPKVIFTTAYREYAVEAFELDVIDYLVKPISFERLLKSIDRYHERSRQISPPESGSISDEAKSISIYSNKKTHKVAIKDILYIEGLKDYALICTRDEKLITRLTMKKLESNLEQDDFIRIHRSFIVPIKGIRSWTSYSVTILGKEIPIGKTYRKDILELLALQ